MWTSNVSVLSRHVQKKINKYKAHSIWIQTTSRTHNRNLLLFTIRKQVMKIIKI